MTIGSKRPLLPLIATAVGVALVFFFPAVTQADEGEDYEPITSADCADCHDNSGAGSSIDEDLSHSIHDGLDCQDCHADKDTAPHKEGTGFVVGYRGCKNCHEAAAEEYISHGGIRAGSNQDIPKCSSCHGGHDILPSTDKRSRTNTLNLPETCGKCHENLDLIKKYDALLDHAIERYKNSVHGRASKGGIHVAATCNDCHSTAGTAHKIFPPGDPRSSINHFKIPDTCGKCHPSIEADFNEGTHGRLVARGETDAPVCTSCHGEHGIISPTDPRSPVSRTRVAEATCAPCHESEILNERYGVPAGQLISFIDSYHGLKSKAGDTHVANCASCHGAHRVLPASDPTSSINPDNLQSTCGECHPGISAEMANQPIHSVSGKGLKTTVADIVEKIYIILIVVVIGGMFLHWLLDLFKQLRILMRKRPLIHRMSLNEVWQHAALMVTFITLAVSGFALRLSESWINQFFFGWNGGFQLRGTIHRTAAVLFILTSIWHLVYLILHRRGRRFLIEMIPKKKDILQFGAKLLYNLGRRKNPPRFERFSYVEKTEYWALIWGTIIMVCTGWMLWFDNWFVGWLPKGTLDVARVIHYYEAWLATLAILVWHLYSTVFSPHVYPMNPSWIHGRMPDEMYGHEHPAHLEEARNETEKIIQAHKDRYSSTD